MYLLISLFFYKRFIHLSLFLLKKTLPIKKNTIAHPKSIIHILIDELLLYIIASRDNEIEIYIGFMYKIFWKSSGK